MNWQTLLLMAALQLPDAGGAQVGPVGALSAPGPGPAAALPDSARSISDVFLGKNVVGPYVLSWKGIEVASESIVVDGRRLARGIDYSLDSGAGVVQFTRPLRNRQVARVDYRCLPGASQPNQAASLLPMQFKLFDAGALTLSATYRPGAEKAGSSPGTGLMLLNLGGQSQLGSSAFTSRLFLDGRGGRVDERGAIQLGQETRTGIGVFKAGFSRGGRQFLAGKETGVAAGKQLFELSGALNPIGGIQAAATFRQTEDLAESGRGPVTTIVGQRLAGTVAGGVRLNASRTETTIISGDGSAAVRIAERLQLDRRIGDRFSTTALMERDQASAGDSRTVSQNSTLAVRAQPTPGISLNGSFQNRLAPSGSEDIAKLQVEAAAAKDVKLGAIVGDRYSRSGVVRDRQANLQYARGPLLSLSGFYNLRNDGAQESIVKGVSASSRPLGFVEVSGGLKLRDSLVEGVAQADTPDTYNVKVALRLWNEALRLTGGYVANPEDDKGVVARSRARNVGLASTLGRVDLAGGITYQDSYLDPSFNAILDFSFGWRFLPNSSFVTSVKESLSGDAGFLITDTYALSLTHRAGSALDLMISGIMTTYQKDGFFLPNRDYKAEAKLGYRF